MNKILIRNNQRGVTLLEILMSIGIITLVSFFLFSSLSSYQNTQVLNTETDILLSMLHDARTKTISAEGNARHGVHFESAKAVSFVGDTYNEAASDNVAHIVDELTTIDGISITGGGNDIVFDSLTGETNFYGTITISLFSDALQSRTITIYQTGVSSR